MSKQFSLVRFPITLSSTTMPIFSPLFFFLDGKKPIRNPYDKNISRLKIYNHVHVKCILL